MTAQNKADRRSGGAHILTMGTSTGNGPDLVDVLIADLKKLAPKAVTVIATADSRDNARRLLTGLGMGKADGRVEEIASAQDFDAAYQATGRAIADLEARGFERSSIMAHYTAGTKVMASGVVLCAVSRGCGSLRYLYSEGRGRASTPVITSPKAVRAEGDLRLAKRLMRELRFRSSIDVMDNIDPELLPADTRGLFEAMRGLAPAYAAWDNFRVRTFLKHYKSVRNASATPEFVVGEQTLDALRRIARVDQTVGHYPVELIFDLCNNAIRRMMERRNDDALTRLYRAAELFAQNILASQFKIRTDDVDIRKIPPRNRVYFEALRRLEDTKIKLGLRKSYELLASLGHPVGEAFLQDVRLDEVLGERRVLVLAHGTKPAPTKVALDMLTELEHIFALEIPNFRKSLDAQQFPWIQNDRVLARLMEVRTEQEPVAAAEEPAQPAPAAPAARKRTGRSRRGGARRRKAT